MSRSHRRRCWRCWMGRVHSVSGAHIRCQGSGAAILKGFATEVRGPEGISGQRWSWKPDGSENLRYVKNPDPDGKSVQNPDLSSCTHFHTRLVVPGCARALQIHSDLVGVEYVPKLLSKTHFLSSNSRSKAFLRYFSANIDSMPSEHPHPRAPSALQGWF